MKDTNTQHFEAVSEQLARWVSFAEEDMGIEKNYPKSSQW